MTENSSKSSSHDAAEKTTSAQRHISAPRVSSSKGKKAVDPKTASRRSAILSDKSPWAIQEAYKQLRTNVLFSLPGTGCQVIGVTSAEPGDGKSINAINHAISFSQLNKHVLLIDCDLRRPSIAYALQMKGVPGLSNYLVNQSHLTDCVRTFNDYMDVLPSGSIPPDATWLLQSDQMKQIMEQFRQIYEYIIVDLPPVTTVADASIVSSYCDGFLFVVRHNQTDIRLVDSAMQQLSRAKARVLGFVYNDSPQDEGRYYYRHTYSSYK